jgi:sodium-coupled neutral amino acid transporter 11
MSIENNETIKKYENSVIASTFNFTNATIGVGVLGIAFALKELGLILGIICLVCVSILATLSLLYIYESHKIMTLMEKNEKNDYEDIAYICFGGVVSNFVKICIILINFGCCASFLIVISDVFSSMVSFYTNNEFLNSKWVITFIVIIPLFIISLTNKISGFRVISYMSIMSVFFFIVFLIITFYHKMNIGQRKGEIHYFKFNISMLRVLGTLVFAFNPHTALCPLQSEFAPPKLYK